MIEAIIKSLDPVFNGMDWVDHYGGLVETWSRTIKGSENQDIIESFPVSRGTSKNCGEPCMALLTPDMGKKNILFFTQEGDAVPEIPQNISRAMRPVRFSQVTRLNVWLNFTDCNTCDSTSYLAYVQYLASALDGYRFTLTAPFPLKGSIRVTSVPNRDVQDVFGAWSFANIDKLFVIPFEFFAIDITFTWIQNLTQSSSCPVIPTC